MNLLRLHFLLLFFICFRTILYSSDFKIILLTSNRGLLVSEDNGNSWEDFNRGLPGNLLPLKIQGDNYGNLYLLTRSSGIYAFEPDKNKWESINSREFLEPAIDSKAAKSKYRRISAFAFDKDKSGTIALATKHGIFRKESGKPWLKLSGYSPENYYTALGFNKDAVYAGTSGNGLFRIAGSHSYNISSNLPKEQYSKNRFFYEEIAGIEFGKGDQNIIYAGLNFGAGVYMSRDNGRSWASLKIPVNGSFYDIFDMKLYNGSLFVCTGAGIYRMDENHRRWHSLSFGDILSLSGKPGNLSLLIIDKTKKYPPLFYYLNDHAANKPSRLTDKARGKRAMYANAYSLNKNFLSYMDTIKKCDLNAIVIDIKDDWGDICFSSANKTALEIGAVKNYADIKKIVNAFKKSGIYTIARIVVFKDKRLYNAYNYKYAIWDIKTKSPWKGNPREYWNDPHSDFVRNYNIGIAEEAGGLGFDEIQFDYIRFPSDGPVDRCYYRFKKTGDIYKSEILACFLEEAKGRINIPISVDIYGFNAWFRMGNVIGQDAERFSEIVDVICPMAYPSHYGAFFMNLPDTARAYRIVLETGKRARRITIGNSVIRPYLQGFNLLSPSWGPEYIKAEIRAAYESGSDGYAFWNAAGHYGMLRKAITGR